jgi:hypothetical protein
MLDGKQIKLTTSVKVYPDQWSKKRHKAYVSDILCASDNRNNEIVNQRIDLLKERFNEFKDYLCNSEAWDVPLSDILKQFIYKDMNTQRKTKTAKNELSATFQMRTINEKSDKTDTTKTNCINTIKSFVRFLIEGKIKNSWNNINDDTFGAYERYLENNNASQATIKVYFNNLKALCRIAGKDKTLISPFPPSRTLNRKKIRQKSPYVTTSKWP